MKILASVFILAIFVLATTSSCKKTVTKTVTDTVQVRAVDTTFVMNAQSWNAFSYLTLALLDSGASTYQTTAEGVKMVGQSPRYGARLQTKSEFGFYNKVVYFKWKGSGGGQFAAFVPQIKYDILSNDSDPQIQGVDLAFFSVSGTATGSTLVQENTWYYTRMVPVAGTDTYQVITSTGNYNNAGGTVINTRNVPLYTKSGYLALRIGDPFGGTNAYCIFGECKIARE